MTKSLLLASGLLAAVTLAVGSPESRASTSDVAEQSVEDQRKAFTEDEVAPRHEPANFDVTIVKYTDYQCPFCRKAHRDLARLVEQDPRVRIIYRDWPIFGPASEEAARLAIASKWQGKHERFHDALMSSPAPLTSEVIRAAADDAGIDWSRLQSDLARHETQIKELLQRNASQARSLGLQGTPAFIVGDTLVEGALDLASMSELVADAR
jgi:protein-disulfide isomerase